jgi:hypothetical protein
MHMESGKLRLAEDRPVTMGRVSIAKQKVWKFAPRKYHIEATLPKQIRDTQSLR